MRATVLNYAALGIAISLVAGATAVAIDRGKEFSPYVDGAGRITLPDPKTVRARWISLGTWALQGDEGVEEFHAVYTQPGTVDIFRGTGEFPDGAVLVKEVRKASHGPMTTGDVARAEDEVLWFVMIKDRKDRFSKSSIWANQWGWALFLAEDRNENTATDFRADCMACHIPARQTDWVFTRGYPVLRD